MSKDTKTSENDEVEKYVNLRDDIVEAAIDYVNLLNEMNFNRKTFKFDNEDLKSRDLLEYRKISEELMDKAEQLIELRNK